MEQPSKLIVIFGVRYSKDRGILIETISTINEEVFFKFHHQPLNRHCEQVQNLIRAANVKRAKKVTMDITMFSYEYFQNNTFMFKGTALKSEKSQIGQVCDLILNKEIGALKRRNTITANKAKNIQEMNAKMEAAEIDFQNKRARRIHELFGAPGKEVRDLPHGSQG